MTTLTHLSYPAPSNSLIADKLTLAQLQAVFVQTNFTNDVECRVIQQLKPMIEANKNVDTSRTNKITVPKQHHIAKSNQCASNDLDTQEIAQVSQLITVFNTIFADLNVVLVRGDGEPEYFPANYHAPNSPAQIVFAHGFFASALHEISHWCIAGTHRRTLNDFGYWYAPDGRSEAQQRAFEQVEIKPQAIECLLHLACGRTFKVSQDNLFADFDTSNSTFERNVYSQVLRYLQDINTLPRDALTLIRVLKAIDW